MSTNLPTMTKKEAREVLSELAGRAMRDTSKSPAELMAGAIQTNRQPAKDAGELRRILAALRAVGAFKVVTVEPDGSNVAAFRLESDAMTVALHFTPDMEKCDIIVALE